MEHFVHTNCIDILLISETHFSSRSYFTLHGYNIIHADHPSGSARGGAAIIIKSSIKFDELATLEADWVQCAKINISSAFGNITIAAAYIPPKHKVSQSQFDMLMNDLGARFIIAGDFNAKNKWWGSRTNNPKGNALFRCIQNKRIGCHASGEPTYWPTDPLKYPDILDIALSKGIDCSKISCSSNADLLSDHSATELLLNLPVFKKAPRQKMFRKGTNLNVYTDWLSEKVNPDQDLSTPELINAAIEELTKEMHNAAAQATPRVPSTPRPPQRNLHLWSPEIAPRRDVLEESGSHPGTQGTRDS